MPHPEPDDLALLALEGSGPAPTDHALLTIVDHVADCPHCQAEVASFHRPVAVAREFDVGEPALPPAHVWDAIAAQLGFDEQYVSYPPLAVPGPDGEQTRAQPMAALPTPDRPVSPRGRRPGSR